MSSRYPFQQTLLPTAMYPQTYLIIILRSLIEFGQIGAEVQSDRSFIFIGLLDTPQIVHQSLEYKLQIWKPM